MPVTTYDPCPYAAAYRAGLDAFVPPERGDAMPEMPEDHPCWQSPDPDVRDNYKDGWNEARCDYAAYIGGGFADRR